MAVKMLYNRETVHTGGPVLGGAGTPHLHCVTTGYAVTILCMVTCGARRSLAMYGIPCTGAL